MLTSKADKRCAVFTAATVAFILACLLVIPWMVIGKGIFYVNGDYITQYMTFGKQISFQVKNAGIGWDWLADLGSASLTSSTPYLTYQPLTLIAMLFPSDAFVYLAGPSVILSFALSAAFSALFVLRYVKRRSSVVIGALAYAFSGFCIQYLVFFIDFGDIVFAPLLLWAIDETVESDKKLLVFIAMLVCATLRYTSMFAIFLFSIIYYFARMPKTDKGKYLAKAPRMIFEGVLALLIMSALLLPRLIAAMDIPRVQEHIALGNIFNYVHYPIVYIMLICCFFMSPELTMYRSMLPEQSFSNTEAYLPMIGLVFVIAYLITRRRAGEYFKRILLICAVILLVPILSSAFTAFKGGFSTRWIFMVVLMLSVCSAIFADDIQDESVNVKKPLRIGALISAAALAAIVLSCIAYKIAFKENVINNKRLFANYMIISIAGIAAAYLLSVCGKRKNAGKRVIAGMICFILLIGHQFMHINHSLLNSADVMKRAVFEADKYLQLPEGEYRTASYNTWPNSNVRINAKTTDYFSSTVSGSIYKFYQNLGIDTVNSRSFETDWREMRAFASVKYVIVGKNTLVKYNETTADAVAAQSDLILVDETEDYMIYENKSCLPFGFAYDNYISLSDWNTLPDEQKPHSILKGVILTDEQAAKHGSLFGKLSLGELSADSFDDDHAALSAKSVTGFSSDAKGFSADYSGKEDTLVVFSVPFDKGWSAKVNGEDAVIESVQGGMCAVPVSAGNSHIVFTYETPGFKTGCILSGVAIIASAAYITAVLIRKRRITTAADNNDQ